MAVPPPSPSPEKAAVRAALRRRRREHVAALARADQVAPAVEAAARRTLPHIPAGAVVALYAPFGSEIDPAPLGVLLAAAGHPLALPYVAMDRAAMRFLAWNHGAPLEAGAYGLRQPAADGRDVAPTVIVTPLVGFDRRGGRIGQGAGFYDRAFAALPGAVRIGYAWSVQELPAIPLDPWDVPLHAIATERAWIVPEAAR